MWWPGRARESGRPMKIYLLITLIALLLAATYISQKPASEGESGTA